MQPRHDRRLQIDNTSLRTSEPTGTRLYNSSRIRKSSSRSSTGGVLRRLLVLGLELVRALVRPSLVVHTEVVQYLLEELLHGARCKQIRKKVVTEKTDKLQICTRNHFI